MKRDHKIRMKKCLVLIGFKRNWAEDASNASREDLAIDFRLIQKKFGISKCL